jgi:hypothetical protein
VKRNMLSLINSMCDVLLDVTNLTIHCLEPPKKYELLFWNEKHFFIDPRQLNMKFCDFVRFGYSNKSQVDVKISRQWTNSDSEGQRHRWRLQTCKQLQRRKMILSLVDELKSHLTIFCDVKSFFSVFGKGCGSWKWSLITCYP